MNTKKGQMGIGNLQSVVWLLVVIGIMLAIGLVVLSELKDTSSIDGEAETALNDTINAIAEVPGWLTIIVIVVIAAIILGLVQFFRGRQ
jgi:hypothetical protein